MKKTKEKKWRHYFIVRLARLILAPILKRSYNFKLKTHRDLKKEGPFLILGNHTVPMDPLLMGSSFPFHIYYFASEQIFNLGLLSKLLVFAVNPIKKKKSMNDISAIRKARKIVLEGGSVGVYPEGNVSYSGKTMYFDRSITKLAKLLKIPIVIFLTDGMYLSDPRWSIYRKRGKTSLEVKEIIYPEIYLEMSEDELYEKLYNSLYVNPYDKEEMPLFKGKKIAEGLERLVFMDLVTNEPLVTYTTNDKLYSKTSDFELTYLPTGYAVDPKGKEYSLVELNEKTIQSYLDYYRNNKSFSFETEIRLEKNYKNRKRPLGKNKFTLKRDGFIIETPKNETIVMDFSDVSAVAVQGKRKIIVYHLDDTYLMTFDDHHSPYIYLLTHEFYKQGENIYDSSIDIQKFGL